MGGYGIIRVIRKYKNHYGEARMVFIETKVFTAAIQQCMSDDAYAALQQHLVEHPDGGGLQWDDPRGFDKAGCDVERRRYFSFLRKAYAFPF